MKEGRNRRNPKDKTHGRASKNIQALTTARRKGVTKVGQAWLACPGVGPLRWDPLPSLAPGSPAWR